MSVGSSAVDNIISQLSNSENTKENLVEPETTVLAKGSVNSNTYSDETDTGDVSAPCKQTISQDVEKPKQVVEPIDWNVLKQSGIAELKSMGTSTKKTIPRSDLLSHVPSETTVVKYGYRTVYWIFWRILSRQVASCQGEHWIRFLSKT